MTRITHTSPSTTQPFPVGPQLTLRIHSSTPALALTTLTLPPHTPGFPILSVPHVSTFYILSGTVTFTTLTSSSNAPSPKSSRSSSSPPGRPRTDEMEASSGDTVTIPSHIPHSFGNGDAEEAVMICVYAPGERWIKCLSELAALTSLKYQESNSESTLDLKGQETRRVLRKWGGVLFGFGGGRTGVGDEMEIDEGEVIGEEGELSHLPAGLRCMAG